MMTISLMRGDRPSRGRSGKNRTALATSLDGDIVNSNNFKQRVSPKRLEREFSPRQARRGDPKVPTTTGHRRVKRPYRSAATAKDGRDVGGIPADR